MFSRIQTKNKNKLFVFITKMERFGLHLPFSKMVTNFQYETFLFFAPFYEALTNPRSKRKIFLALRNDNNCGFSSGEQEVEGALNHLFIVRASRGQGNMFFPPSYMLSAFSMFYQQKHCET